MALGVGVWMERGGCPCVDGFGAGRVAAARGARRGQVVHRTARYLHDYYENIITIILYILNE